MLSWKQLVKLLIVGLLPVMAAAQTTSTAGPITSRLETVSASPAAIATPVIKVEYRNGQLALVAENANLGEVLAEVSARTGIEIDVASAAASQKVDIQLGPAGAREVLVKLLSSPHLDYIMLGSATNAGAVERIEVDATPEAAAVESDTPSAVTETKPDPSEEAASEAAPQPAGVTSARSMLSPDELADYWKRAQEAQLSLERERNLRQIQLIDDLNEQEKQQQKQQKKNKPAEPK